MKYSGCTIFPSEKKAIKNHIHHKPNMGYKLHAILTYEEIESDMPHQIHTHTFSCLVKFTTIFLFFDK